MTSRKPEQADSKRQDPASKQDRKSEDRDAAARKAVPSHGLSLSRRRVASALILVQFCILILSLASNLSPSTLQGNLLDWAEYYTISTAQDYGAVAIELSHGETLDFPVAVQVQRSEDDPDEWTTLALPGVTFSSERPVDWSRSRWANLSRSVRLLYNDTNDSEALAILASATVSGFSIRGDGDLARLRIVSPTVVSFNQYESVVEAKLRVGEAFADEVVYTADLVRLSTGELVLVPEEETLRTSKSTLLPEVSP